MKIVYKINNINHSIKFCTDKESPDIVRELKKHYSDQNLLVVLDKKLKNNFKKYLIKDLKKSGKKIFLITVEANKKNKNEKLLFKILDELIKHGFTKKSVIISCGGGVVGDVCALASSLYLRGLIYYHIPTTMTAIVDSCIGGKTGINYKNIINSVGNYYHPRTVFISKNVINLIPDREFFSGLPEIMKSGLINNSKILFMLKNEKYKCLSRDYNYLSKLIFLTLKTKIKFFKDDIYENSTRLNLNFGHTFAHAIEMAIKSKTNDIIRHGEAVGIGMLCEIHYVEGKGKNFKFLEMLLKNYRLPTNINSFVKTKSKKMVLKKIYNNIFLDKKRINKFPRIIELKKIGKSKIFEMKNNKKIMETIKNVII